MRLEDLIAQRGAQRGVQSWRAQTYATLWNPQQVNFIRARFFNMSVTSVKYSPPDRLSLRDNRMTDVPLGLVVAALEKSNLLKLDLSENRVGASAIGKLCAFLKQENCLEARVVFGDCRSLF